MDDNIPVENKSTRPAYFAPLEKHNEMIAGFNADLQTRIDQISQDTQEYRDVAQNSDIIELINNVTPHVKESTSLYANGVNSIYSTINQTSSDPISSEQLIEIIDFSVKIQINQLEQLLQLAEKVKNQDYNEPIKLMFTLMNKDLENPGPATVESFF
jgi:hypothetical protein